MPENLTRLSDALVTFEARLRSDTDPQGIPFEAHPALLAQMVTADLTTRCDDLDVAFAPTGIDGGYDELDAGSDTYELYGHRVKVASLDHIIRSKEAADRPKARAVLPILYARRDELDVRAAVKAELGRGTVDSMSPSVSWRRRGWPR